MIFLLIMLHIGVVIGDWIEITKVGHLNTDKQIVEAKKLLTATPPSYKVTLDRPTINLQEIKILKNNFESENRNGNSSSFEKLMNNNNESDDEEAEIFIEDEKINEQEIDDEDDDEQNKKQMSVISIIKNVQTQLLDFKGRSLQAKVDHLEKLRDNMIYEIKYQISDMLHLSKENQPESRLFKDDSGEYHMEYPSNEGALMTIGLLTFAVFLIKLVLKLIYIFKLKQQNYYYATTTTTPVSIFLRETERDDKIDESVRILRYLDEYSPS